MPPTFTPRTDLAGDYTVVVDADSRCVDLPQAAKQRTYAGTLELTSYAYLTIHIVGGGFTKPTVVGDLWNAGHISWNNFDIPGCDGQREPLNTTSEVMICGDGTWQLQDSTITATLTGSISVYSEVDDALGDSTVMIQTSTCSGNHRVTFRRVTPS